MIRQHFHPLHVFKDGYEFAREPEVFIVVSQPRHQNVSDPDGSAAVGKIPQHIKDVGVVLAGQGNMPLRVNMLYIHDEKIGQPAQLAEFRQKMRLPREGLSRRVDAGVDSPQLGVAEKIKQEVDLQQRFAATVMPPSFPQ